MIVSPLPPVEEIGGTHQGRMEGNMFFLSFQYGLFLLLFCTYISETILIMKKKYDLIITFDHHKCLYSCTHCKLRLYIKVTVF